VSRSALILAALAAAVPAPAAAQNAFAVLTRKGRSFEYTVRYVDHNDNRRNARARVRWVVKRVTTRAGAKLVELRCKARRRAHRRFCAPTKQWVAVTAKGIYIFERRKPRPAALAAALKKPPSIPSKPPAQGKQLKQGSWTIYAKHVGALKILGAKGKGGDPNRLLPRKVSKVYPWICRSQTRQLGPEAWNTITDPIACYTVKRWLVSLKRATTADSTTWTLRRVR